MCSFLAANWLIANLTYANFFLQPRGPDATRRWQGYGFEFVHNLLHMTGEMVLQPFHNEEAGVVALFNGELYNWKDLQQPGEIFQSDGEAIISEYLRTGRRFVRKLDGEFALAVFDFARGEALFATDPFGTKPLRWLHDSNGRLAVASYASALLRIGADPMDIRALEPNSAIVIEIPKGQGNVAPVVLSQFTVFEFDLRQHKTHSGEWQEAFLRAVGKRAQSSRTQTPALCWSDGYDSGAISLALAKLGVDPALYTVQAREDIRILARRLQHLGELGLNATWSLSQLSSSDFQNEREFLHEHAERVEYKLRPDYANVDDKAAAGLSWIYRQAAKDNQRLFLSGTGADELISDYGNNGQAFEFHSTLRGTFPEDLQEVFPWLNFFQGTQRDYLAKEETAAGSHGVETRYPFLDRSLVQEYLWLHSSYKNSVYKAPLQDLFTEDNFPFIPGTKRGFSADKNLAGHKENDPKNTGDAGLIAAREELWSWAGGDTTTVISSCSLCSEDSRFEPSRANFSLAQLLQLIGEAPSKTSEPLETGGGWASELRNLPTFREAREALEQGQLAPPLSLAAANGFEPRHRVVVLTSCMEEEYFLTYCGPMISSFGDHSKLDDRWGDPLLRLMVATAGVSSTLLDAVSNAFHFVEIVDFKEHQDDLSSHEDPTEAENYRRMSYNSLKLRQYLRLWQDRILGTEVDYVVCMDSDMLIVKPFAHVFELLEQLRVDVTFSYYDGSRKVPWGSPDEAALTKGKGYVRLQGGLLLMRNNRAAIQWFAVWDSLTVGALHYKEEEGPSGEKWRDLLQEFKGPSQASLAFLLAQGEVEIMKEVKSCCSRIRTIHLEPLVPDGDEVPVRMFGLPSQYLNDAESTEDGSLPSLAHIVHLKGHWWRTVLPEGHEHIETPTRSYEWNREAFELWKKHSAFFNWVMQQSGYRYAPT